MSGEKLQKSDKYFRKAAYNNSINKSENKSKEIQKQLDIANNKLRAQESANSRLEQQRKDLDKALSQEKQRTAALDKELRDSRDESNKANVKMVKLQKLFKDLDGKQSKVTESDEQAKKIQGLTNNLECAMKWCRALDQHVQDFFLFSAHIAENWHERKVEDLDLVEVASDLCDCVKHAMGMIRPE